jgi:mRNA-degrading endonuclease RelE of RelBE toxin-antitoxin system
VSDPSQSQRDQPDVRLVIPERFARAAERLVKRYRSLSSDLEPLFEALRAGARPGDAIPGLGGSIFKTRLPNRDAGRGQSGGYRVIYLVESPELVVLLMIYSKSDQADIASDAVRRLVREWQAEQARAAGPADPAAEDLPHASLTDTDEHA